MTKTSQPKISEITVKHPDTKQQQICEENTENIDLANLDYIETNENYIRVLHLNIRTINKNVEELESMYQLRQFDIKVLSESFQILNLDLYKMENLIYNESSINKNDIEYILGRLYFSHTVKYIGNIKGMVLNFQYKNVNFVLTAVYRPPSDDTNMFLDILLHLLKTLQNNHVTIVFL